MASEKTYGTFEKDGDTRVAYSPQRAVELRFNGWAEQSSEKSAPAKKTASTSQQSSS